MDTHVFDIIVIGAGIVGATAAAHLGEDRRVALIEAEEVAGYHTTGRSAALWLQNYGPPDAQALSRLSREFLVNPPAGFSEARLLGPRGALYLVTPEQMDDRAVMLRESQGVREIGMAAALAMVPAIRGGYAVAALYEDDAGDLDVAAIHQGFLRLLRNRQGVLALRSRAGRIARQGGEWAVEVTGGAVFRAPIVVNAAGAWGDEVAGMAGVAPVGLEPKRRTACIVDPGPWQVADWPAVHDLSDTWYCRPEARTKLMVSPADETPSYPHDVQPEEIDIATGVHQMQQALDLDIRRIEHSWAGLRTFAPDRSLVIGFDAVVDGFFWCVGQGGYGIQTSPATGRLVADLIGGRDPGAARGILAMVDPARFAR